MVFRNYDQSKINSKKTFKLWSQMWPRFAVQNCISNTVVMTHHVIPKRNHVTHRTTDYIQNQFNFTTFYRNSIVCIYSHISYMTHNMTHQLSHVIRPGEARGLGILLDSEFSADGLTRDVIVTEENDFLLSVLRIDQIELRRNFRNLV